jgi:hypothetical protein
MGQQDESLLFGTADIGPGGAGPDVANAEKDSSPGEVQVITGSLLIDRAAGTPIWLYIDQLEVTSLTTELMSLVIKSATASGGSFSTVLELQLGTGTAIAAKGLGSLGAIGIMPELLGGKEWLRADIGWATGTPTTGQYRVGLGLQETGFMKILA